MIFGAVYLIGAGPGDPGLITVRGLERLRHADVVVYDRLAHPSLLEHARPDAERIYVGKASAAHAMRQPEINALLIDRAKLGKNVARLKGGDPFVFGRGGEEAEACRDAGIRFEIVPGITSAIAAPAYAGIPVTHRDASSSFAVITGHERDDRGEAGSREPGNAEGRRNWAHIAHAADTLLFLMGVEALPEIVARLIENGRESDTPVAVVQWGTWPKQRVVVGTLEGIVDEVRQAGLTPPAVCVVGDVVKLRERLRWFDSPDTKPLLGKRVVVTRAREQASGLSDLLRQRGAEPIEFPVIRIVPPKDTDALDAALLQLPEYDWVIFTSANTVPMLAARFAALGRDSRQFGGVKIAAIGPATAAALKHVFGIVADFVPGEAVAEAMLAEWPDAALHSSRILIPRAAEARDILPKELRERGAHVDVVAAYETHTEQADTAALRGRLEAGEIDGITFTASSTVRNFAQALGISDSESARTLLGRARIIAIGPITAATAEELGIPVEIVAGEHTIPGLMQAIETLLGAHAPDTLPDILKEHG